MPSPSFGTTHANGRQPQSPSPRFGPAQCMSMMMPRAGQVATHRPLKLAGRLRAPDTRPRWLLSGVVCPLCRDHTAPWLARRAVAGPLPPLPFPSTNDASWNPAAIVSIPSNKPLTCHVEPACVPLALNPDPSLALRGANPLPGSSQSENVSTPPTPPLLVSRPAFFPPS